MLAKQRVTKKVKHGSHEERHESTVFAARTVLDIVVDTLPHFRSAIDFGCGVGTWLSIAKEKGAEDILGSA
jgi:ribosomal protein L11 methylase PrmA